MRFFGRMTVNKKLERDRQPKDPMASNVIPPLKVKKVKGEGAGLNFGARKVLPASEIAEPAEPASETLHVKPSPVRTAPKMRLVPLMELATRGECKWPVESSQSSVGAFLFCAAPTELERSYCPHHYAIGITGRLTPERRRG
jgi:hypothetical protein